MAQNIKYQIFVSSTYEDLKAEREQVIKAILEMGHIPVGMEMFSAADEEQWKIISRQIDESDYYVVIIAHRYGSIIDGISYTEKEYDYAVKNGIPVIGFIIDQTAPWPHDRVDNEPNQREGLELFKEKVRKKPVGFWTSADDLYGKFSIALIKLINTNPRPGWARATDLIGPDVMRELSRLSSENASLRTALEQASTQTANDIELEYRKLSQTLVRIKVEMCFKFTSGTDWSERKEVSMIRLFKAIAPEMMSESTTTNIANKIVLSIGGEISHVKWPVPTNYLSQWLADLAILDLVEPSPKKHAVKDTNEYWILTKQGQNFFKYLRKNDLEKQIQANRPKKVSKLNKTTK